MRRHFLVAYDIRDDKRLRKVLKTCEGFGDRLQFSVFLCQLNDKDLVILRERLHDLINHHEDSIVMLNLGRVADEPGGPDALERRMTTLGVPWDPPDRRALII